MTSFSKESYLAELRMLKSDDELIPFIVHDLRNKTNSVLSVTSILKSDLDTSLSLEQCRDFVDILDVSAREILAIVNAALAYHQEKKSAR